MIIKIQYRKKSVFKRKIKVESRKIQIQYLLKW